MSKSKQDISKAFSNDETENQFSQRKFPAEPQLNPKKSERIRKGKQNFPTEMIGSLEVKKQKELKGLDAKQTIIKKKESDLDHPHQLQRHSGTGIPAYERKEKKGGGGVHNWGTISVKEDFEEQMDDNMEEEIFSEERDTLPIDDKAVAFDEYVEKKSTSEIHQPVNESKIKVTDEELLKEIGKAIPLEAHKSRESDDHKEAHQPKKYPEDYHISMNTEHAGLLGFQTDVKEDEIKHSDKAKEDIVKEKQGAIEKSEEPTKNPIKKALNYVEEKLGLKPKSEDSKIVHGINLEDESIFPKLD